MRIAQVQDGQAHWVFQATDMPIFASYVKLVDVSAITPPVQEGWAYDGVNFIAPPPPPPVKTPCGTDLQAGVAYSSPVPGTTLSQIWLIYFDKAGTVQPVHTNPKQQFFLLVRGSVSATIGVAIPTPFTAPAAFNVLANVSHGLTSAADGTVVVTWYA